MGQPHCPTCRAPLSGLDDHITCDNGHRFAPEGLALASNHGAVAALWRAITALEDDAAGLDWMVRSERAPQHQRDNYIRQAAEGRHAAELLRRHAKAAQDRLDSLPNAPSVDRSAADGLRSVGAPDEGRHDGARGDILRST